MKKYNISRMKARAEFGTIETIDNQNDQPVPTFVPKLSVYCGSYGMTANQSYSNIGLNIQIEKAIAIRHNDTINQMQESSKVSVRLNGVVYDVINIIVDDDIHGFDIVNLTKNISIK